MQTGGISMHMDDAALYRLMIWLSPAFPVGAFSYSHGLEWAIEAGMIKDRDDLSDWIAAILTDGAGRSDAILLAHAWRAANLGDEDGLWEVAELAAALRSTAELARESTAQGDAFRLALRAAWPDLFLEALASRLTEKNCALTYPVAVGVAAARADVGLEATLFAYLQAFAANLVSAAVRLVPLGQSDGLRVLAVLESFVHKAAIESQDANLDDLGGAALMVDICSIRHETQYTRLFRS